MAARRPPVVPIVLVGIGLMLVHQTITRYQRRMTAEVTVEAVFRGQVPVGQAISVPRARIAFDPALPAEEFDRRDPSGERKHSFVLVRDAETEWILPMLYWRTTFLQASSDGPYTRAEVRGTLRRTPSAWIDRLSDAFPELSRRDDARFYLDDMEFEGISGFTVAGTAIGFGMLIYGALLLARWARPREEEVVLPARRTGRARTPAAERQRDCRACGEGTPVASRTCGHCQAPIEVEYYVAAATPLDGFEKLVPVSCQILGVSEYQARRPLARVHTPLPYNHVEGFHVKGPGEATPFRLVSRGIPSLVTAQALAAAFKERGAESVIVGSDELAGGPFARPASSLTFDENEVTFHFAEGQDVEERTVPWNRFALIVFSADMPLTGTMTIARDLRDGMPRDASAYLVDLYERGSDEGIRIAEDSFYRWEFLRLGGSERPADRFGRLIDLLESRARGADVHYVTGAYKGPANPWRLNFYSRFAYMVGDKSDWAKQEGPPKLEGYEMLDKVGEGAMGAVYRARQRKLGRIVAVKVVAPHLAAERTFLARFEAEARAVAALSHPNIVQVMDLTEWGGRYFMIMEFVDGVTVQSLVKRHQRLEEEETLRIGLAVASALEHAAARGIVHRDIKPENVFVTSKGEVKVGDWGLAKDLGDDLGLTETGTAVGTPYYMSPEQARARKDLDVRSDLYSLGATMFHALTGRPPFRGGSPTEVLMQHLQAPPPDPRRLRPDIDGRTAALLLRLLEKDPDARCDAADEIVHELEELIESLDAELALV